MKVIKLAQILMVVGTIFSTATAMGIETTSSVHPLVQQARIRAAEGDREGAAALYHQVLEEDANNMSVRNELAKLLIEAKVEIPIETEELDEWDLKARANAKSPENL